jgi:hypothetical protein
MRKLLAAAAAGMIAAAPLVTASTAQADPTDRCQPLARYGPAAVQSCIDGVNGAPQGCSNNPFSKLPNCGTPCTGQTVIGPGGTVIHNPPGCDPNAPLS